MAWRKGLIAQEKWRVNCSFYFLLMSAGDKLGTWIPAEELQWVDQQAENLGGSAPPGPMGLPCPAAPCCSLLRAQVFTAGWVEKQRLPGDCCYAWLGSFPHEANEGDEERGRGLCANGVTVFEIWTFPMEQGKGQCSNMPRSTCSAHSVLADLSISFHHSDKI